MAFYFLCVVYLVIDIKKYNYNRKVYFVLKSKVFQPVKISFQHEGAVCVRLT